MPVPVQLIFRDNPGALPASQDLAAALDMEFAASRVRINGAGAAASFIPVLEVLGQDGTIIAQARPDQVFAIGDTGVVTFAPFLRPVRPGEHSVRIERTANQSIPNNALTAVVYQSVRFENNEMADLAAQPTRITIPPGGRGRYLFVACGVWDFFAMAAGGSFQFLRLNGATFIGEWSTAVLPAGNISYSVSGVWDCSDGDFVETMVLQNSGAAVNLLGSNTPRVYMSALRVFPR